MFGAPFLPHVRSLIPARISNYIHYEVWDEIIYPFTNFKGCTIEVCEWILSNFTPHFIGHVITYPCWEQSQTMLVKWPPAIDLIHNDDNDDNDNNDDNDE